MITYEEAKEWIFQTLYPKKVTEIINLNTLNDTLAMEYSTLQKDYRKQELVINALNSKVTEQRQILDQGWNNPYGWNNYNGSFQTITGVQMPANSTITPQDKTLRALASKLRGQDILESAEKIEKYLHRYVRYVYDHQNNFHPDYVEFFQTASFTWAIRKGDCDDFAILFATLMHILGYGDQVVVRCGEVTWHNGDVFGHAYNSVLVNGLWKVFDSQAGPTNKGKVVYRYDKTYFFFNYYGVFK